MWKRFSIVENHRVLSVFSLTLSLWLQRNRWIKDHVGFFFSSVVAFRSFCSCRISCSLQTMIIFASPFIYLLILLPLGCLLLHLASEEKNDRSKRCVCKPLSSSPTIYLLVPVFFLDTTILLWRLSLKATSSSRATRLPAYLSVDTNNFIKKRFFSVYEKKKKQKKKRNDSAQRYCCCWRLRTHVPAKKREENPRERESCHCRNENEREKENGRGNGIEYHQVYFWSQCITAAVSKSVEECVCRVWKIITVLRGEPFS